MAKHGLGRGLNSLFAIYDDAEKKPVPEKTKPAARDELDDVLEKANSLIQTSSDPSFGRLSDINETVENRNYLTDKLSLSKKLDGIERTLSRTPTGEAIYQIALTKLEPNAQQPRKTFDKESLQELADSITQHGVIQPIVVVERAGNFMIVAGERRFRAAKIAKLKTIPAIIKDYTDTQIKEIALIENLQREDLNPVETAYALKQLLDDYKLSQDEIAKRIGKSRPVVTNYLRILKLEPEVLTMVDKGKLSLAHAKALVGLTDQDLQIKLARKAADGKMASREVELAVQTLLNPEKSSRIKQELALELKNLANDMQYVFGTRVGIIGSNIRGRIYLDYYSKDDLDRVFNIIEKIKR